MVKCRRCESVDVSIQEKNGQDVVRCNRCLKWSHNAPKTETGRKARTVSTTHEAIKASVRAEVLLRATGRCEMCGAATSLTVGHLVSVKAGHDGDLTDDEINSLENLCAMCNECNAGLGATPVPLRLAISMILKRIERGAT
jgi:5-methylcytosine-specific restriction endonuclease McrA